MKKFNNWIAIICCTWGIAFSIPSTFTLDSPRFSGWTISPRHNHRPADIRQRNGKNATSTNWSGYAITGVPGSVTNAKGRWVVPHVTCNNGAPDSYAAIWVGIDGYNSATVEQIGIDADCIGGQPQYSAWFEFYPHWPYTINNFPLSPGDTISAEVSYGVQGKSQGQFTLTLTNLTALHQPTFSTTSKMPQAKQTSAEWIVEAPWSSSVLPLANFGTTIFTQSFATVNGRPGTINSFDPNVVKLDMVTQNGALKAQTSALGSDGSSFSIAFVSPGP